MLKEAVQRITSGTIDFSQLFYEKLTVLWQTDDAPIFYGKTVMEQPEKLSAQCMAFIILLGLAAWREHGISSVGRGRVSRICFHCFFWG